MRLKLKIALLGLAAVGLAACEGQNVPPDASPIEPVYLPPFDPIATNAVLMRGTIALAAADYWASVSIVFDLEGEHQNFPVDDEEWSRVWASAITLAESGNLLMMAPRALDQGDWMRLSQDLIDAGLEAARAADAQDGLAVLDAGEKVYNVCTACHEQYMPTLRI